MLSPSVEASLVWSVKCPPLIVSVPECEMLKVAEVFRGLVGHDEPTSLRWQYSWVHCWSPAVRAAMTCSPTPYGCAAAGCVCKDR